VLDAGDYAVRTEWAVMSLSGTQGLEAAGFGFDVDQRRDHAHDSPDRDDGQGDIRQLSP
jgi:hypothetical protein